MSLRSIHRYRLFWVALVLSGFCGCGPQPPALEKVKVAGVYSASIEDPWVNVVHQALLTAERELEVAYDFTENVIAADFEPVIRDYAERSYEIIFGDAYNNEDISRRLARDYPEIAFCFGSAFGPTEPNFSVFDSWIQEPAYICGMIAGKLTKTNILGAVGGKAVPGVNRLLQAFNWGAKEVNPAVKLKVAYLGSWFDPPQARKAASALIEAGADLLYGERAGVIEACQLRGVLAFGNIHDQNSLAPDTVVTGPVWDMGPTVTQVIADVREGKYQSLDYGQWSTMFKGGAYLAPYHSLEKILPREVREMAEERRREILAGTFRVPVNDLPLLSE